MQKIDQTLEKLGFAPYYRLPVVQSISAKTNVKPPIIILGALVLMVIVALTPIGGTILTTLLAFMLPAFRTFEALESETHEDDEELLTYWIVFGVVYSLDEMFRFVFSFIPMYHLIRYAILLALYAPQFNGAQILYRRAIRPFFMNYRTEIDKVVQPIEERSKNLSESLKRKSE